MVQFLETDAGIGGAALPVNALLGRVAGLRPRGDLRGDRVLRGPARGQGLPRQDAQLRFGPVEPTAVPGRKHQLDALCQAARLGGRKRPEKRGVRVGVQIVTDQDQALGVAVARMIREGLDLVRPVHGRAPRGGVGHAPLAQRFHEHPDRAGAVPHVFIVVGGGLSRTRRLRRPLVAPQQAV